MGVVVYGQKYNDMNTFQRLTISFAKKVLPQGSDKLYLVKEIEPAVLEAGSCDEMVLQANG